MLPQFDSSSYFSQVFWLFICFIVLILAFKRYFVPRMDYLLARREAYIEKTDESAQKLEKEIAAMNEEIKKVSLYEHRRSAETVANARKKVAALISEHTRLVKLEREGLLGSTRSRLNNEIKSLDSTFKGQVDIISQLAFDKLFAQRI